MKKIYFVRHGQTVANAAGLVQDAHDPLNDAGRAQAIVLAERAAKISFSELIVSDYERTRETVEPLLSLTECVPEYSPLFREVRRPSEFFGQSNDTEGYRSFLSAWSEHLEDANWHHSDEENFHDLTERAAAATERLLSTESDILVISHGMFIRFLVQKLVFGEHFTPSLWRRAQYRLSTSNTGITVVRYDGDWSLLTWNDHAHFAE